MTSENSSLPSSKNGDELVELEEDRLYSVKLSEFSYTWTISWEEFDNIMYGINTISSSTFPFNAESSWRLELVLDECGKKMCDLQACLCTSDSSLIVARFEVQETDLRFGTPPPAPWYTFQLNEETVECKNVICRRYLKYANSEQYWRVKRGTNYVKLTYPMTIVCHVTVRSFEAVADRRKQVEAIEVLPSAEGDAEDLSSLLFEDRAFSDVSIDVQGREIRAHRAILARASRVFWTMIEDKLSGQAENPLRLSVTSVDYETFQEMLRFVYTGAVRSIDEMAEKLFAAATEYRITRLKDMCEKALCSRLSIENAAGTLALADLHDAKDLKARALSFIVANLARVLETEDFKLLTTSHPHGTLMIEILRATTAKRK